MRRSADLGIAGCALIVVVFFALAGLFSLIPAGICFAFWNWIAVPKFKWPVLTFWQVWLLWFVLAMFFNLARGSSKSD